MSKHRKKKLASTRELRVEAHQAVRAAQATGCPPEELAKQALAHLLRMTPKPRRATAERIVEAVLASLAPFDLPADGSVPTWVKRLVAGARSRDRAAGRTTETLTDADVMAMFKKQNGSCLVSGIPFSADDDRPRALISRPFAPSLDRVSADLGYTQGNVRLVSVAANLAMNAWGLEALHKLAQGVVQTSLLSAETRMIGEG